MNTLHTARSIGRTAAAGVLVALALTACGTEQSPSVQQQPVAQTKVQGIGSADAIEQRLGSSGVTMVGTPDALERRLAAGSVPVSMVGTPDALERRLAAAAGSGCHTSADAAERAGADACR
jgi:hypothetical protein